MFEFHKDKERYFNIQYWTARDYIIPFVKDYINFDKELKVLEIGCAEAGVLKAFTENNHKTMGIEMAAPRVELAKQFMAKELEAGLIQFRTDDIYDIATEKDLPFKFDLIILKDVIEHIHKQENFIPRLKDFLNEGGKVFFAFPPWQMPFGGHQQVLDNAFLSKLPYFHLLPMPIYKGIMKLFGERPEKIEDIAEIKETGISIERFEKLCKKSDLKIYAEKHFLFNPIYKWKFGLNPREQFGFITKLPYIRNYFTTCAYYLVGN